MDCELYNIQNYVSVHLLKENVSCSFVHCIRGSYFIKQFFNKTPMDEYNICQNKLVQSEEGVYSGPQISQT